MMDKWFIKELALENGFKLKQQPNGEMDLNPYVYEFASALIDPAYKVISELEKQRDRFKAACDEWIDKTDWVQTTCQGSELGLHRADVLAMRIEKLEQQLAGREAEVIHRFINDVNQFSYLAYDADSEYMATERVVTVMALQNHAKRLHRKAQEPQ